MLTMNSLLKLPLLSHHRLFSLNIFCLSTRHGCDHMVVGFTTTYAITTNVVSSNPIQVRCIRYNIM